MLSNRGFSMFKHATDLNEVKMSFKNLTLYYSVLFVIVSSGIFSVFFICGNSFIEYGDGFRQGCFNILNLKHVYSSILSGNGIPLWNWSKGFGAPNKFLPDPFNTIAALFPLRHLELGISISILMKIYCGGLAFLFFTHQMHMSNYKCLSGSICYAFSTWFLNIAVFQSVFLFTSYVIPLVILSIDWIARGKTPLLFIASVVYTLIRDPYTAYIIAIAAIIFMLLRYFTYNDLFSIKSYITYVLRFIIYGSVAGLISSVFSLQYVIMAINASTESANAPSYGLFWGLGFVESFGKHLISFGYCHEYSYIGIPVLALLVLPIAFKKISIKRTNLIMSIILIALAFSPLACSMFNGFSYTSARWYVLIVFFVIWSSVECFDIEYLRQKKNTIMMLIWLVVISLWTIGFSILGTISLSLRGTAFILINLMAGALLILAICCFNFSIKQRQLLTIGIMCITLMASWSMNFYLFQDKFIPLGYTNELLAKSTQRVSPKIDDDGFYRVDQVDWTNINKEMEMPANENLWWQSKNLYSYDSLISPEQFKLNKYLGNNYGYRTRVYILSNDNRMGLDFLTGVKYFLGDDKRNDTTGSDAYAGYGFNCVDNIDGVNIFKSRYDVSLGFAYDKFISESEFLKLNRPEREQAMLQAAVIPDEIYNKTHDITEEKAEDIETSVTNLNYTISNCDGISINNNEFIVEKDNASFCINTDRASNSQILFSLDNCTRNEGGSFRIYCSNENIRKTAGTDSSNQGLPNVHDFDLNMGYYDNEFCKLTIEFSKTGTYSFDDMRISAMSTDVFDKYAKQRIQNRLNINSYSNSSVNGTINVDNNSILYFSIPQYDNWEVYIDGEKTQKISNVNIAFFGAQVPAGNHEIVLKYESKPFVYGLIASIIGLLLTLAIISFQRKNKR